MRRPPPATPAPKTVEYDPNLVLVSREPLITKGPIELEVPATTYQWHIAPQELEKALRPYIHETVQHLPANHLLKVEPIMHAEGQFEGVSFTIVVPERR